MKEKTELFTQGVASHVPEILKEIQRLRAREEKRDMQWAKVEKEMEGLKTEVEKTKNEQRKLEVKVETLSTALDNKSKEAETEKVGREKLEKEIGKLEAKVSEQGKAIETEKSERKLENERWEKKWKKVEEALKKSTGDIQTKVEKEENEERREDLRVEKEEERLDDNSQNKGLIVGVVTLPKKDQISLTDNKMGQERKRFFLETLIGAASLDVPSFAKRSKEEEKKLCWYCMKGVHKMDDCPGLRTDREKGLVSLDENNRLVDRKGNLIKRTKEGFRVQLYEQLGLTLEN
ncbi:hypothetical protein CBR_g19556 [Chara braunii]|uniref:CCHC-type domain-containing protein n=1 Tax=Chara braunii TaxID=69332 RepID=A0A388KYM3_CHABU|nr:hypothetical protein CBR_g19556 [Chara braunii]|eukprot:GBG75043.1 hypothetical protein CBR_g19556 [Chara braunii]